MSPPVGRGGSPDGAGGGGGAAEGGGVLSTFYVLVYKHDVCRMLPDILSM